MKHSYRLIQLVLFSLLILTGCEEKEKKQTIVKEFPSSQKLKGEPLTSIVPYYPYKINVEDTLLIVLNRDGKNFFQVYNTNTMQLMTEFGSKGRGPGEFLEPAFINQKIDLDEKLYHLIYDTGIKRISYVNIGDFVKNKTATIKQEKLPKRMGDPDRFIYYSDTLSITAPGDMGGGRFQIFKGDSMQTTGYLPKLAFDIHKDNYYSIYNNTSSLIHNKKRKIVGTTHMLGQYDFFDFSGNLLYSTVIHRDENLKKNIKSSMEIKNPIRMFYRTDLKSVGDLIYSIYYKYESTKGSSSTKSRIHVLDWNGNPIKEYLLDKLILSFAYDKINNCFYGIAPYEEDYQIIKYDIK